MTQRPWFVQVRDEDGLFHTRSEHQNLSQAFAVYTELDGVRMLLRGAHVVLRSDVVDLADRPTDALL